MQGTFVASSRQAAVEEVHDGSMELWALAADGVVVAIFGDAPCAFCNASCTHASPLLHIALQEEATMVSMLLYMVQHLVLLNKV